MSRVYFLLVVGAFAFTFCMYLIYRYLENERQRRHERAQEEAERQHEVLTEFDDDDW